MCVCVCVCVCVLNHLFGRTSVLFDPPMTCSISLDAIPSLSLIWLAVICVLAVFLIIRKFVKVRNREQSDASKQAAIGGAAASLAG